MQAAYIGLLKAKETYNPKKKSKFSSWAYFKINWEVQKERNNFYLTRCSPNWRKNRPETYDTLEDSNIDPGLNPCEELCRKEEWEEEYSYMRSIMDRLHKKLTQQERQVFLAYYIHNKRVSDIKKAVPNAYRIIERLKEKLRLLLLLDGR